MNLKEVYNSILTESSLSRIWKLVEDDKYSFAVISAFRKANTPKDNASRHFNLKRDAIEGKHGFIELRGGYVETSEDGEKVPVTEDSMLINGIKKEDALKLGAKYEQEAILFKDATGFQLLDVATGNPIISFKKGAGKDNVTLAQQALSEFFSSLKKGSHAGKKFAFVQEHEEWSWLKAMSKRERKWFTILLNEENLKDNQK